MPNPLRFSGIYMPIQVASKKPVDGKPPTVFPQKTFPNRRKLMALSGFTDAPPRVLWETFDRKGNLLFVTDDDVDGYTSAVNARTDIQDTVNELDAAMKAEGIQAIPLWGPIGEINRRAEAMKREVFYNYLDNHKNRIEKVPYYVTPTPIRRLIQLYNALTSRKPH